MPANDYVRASIDPVITNEAMKRQLCLGKWG